LLLQDRCCSAKKQRQIALPSLDLNVGNIVTKSNSDFLKELYQLLYQYCSWEEIQDLCHKLGVECQNMPGEGKSERIRELLLFAGHKNRIPDLIALAGEVYPDVDWPHVPHNFQIPASLTFDRKVVFNDDYYDRQGDVVGGDKIVVGDISSSNAAIGAGAQIIINQIQQVLSTVDELDRSIQVAERRLAEAIRNKLGGMTKPTADFAEERGNPYKALLDYRIEDAPFFYGRFEAISAMYDRLGQSRLTILHSESGSGKSSLLQAGLASRLLAEGHFPLYLRPYDQRPGQFIKKAFLSDYAVQEELARFSDDNMTLKGFLERVTYYLGERQLILFLDQFEEFFTELSKEEQEEFATQLRECVESDLPVWWVLALRKEYFSNLRLFNTLKPFENEYFLPKFKVDEAQEVIVEPAALKEVGYEEGLVEQILDDIRQNSAEIPPAQVQLVCFTLFDELSGYDLGKQITFDLYNKPRGRASDAPGAAGILTSHLGRVLERKLNEQERNVAVLVMEELVTADRRRVMKSKENLLEALDPEQAALLEPVLAVLYNNRLVRGELGKNDVPVYELAHDYLVREIELRPETQARKAAQELLNQEVHAYRQHGTLLSEDKFAIINNQRGNLQIDDTAGELLERSGEAIESDRWRELEREKKLAEEQRLRAEEQENLAEEQRLRAEEQQKLAEEQRLRAEEGDKAANSLRKRLILAMGAFLIALIFFGVAAVLGYQSRINASIAATRAAEAIDAGNEAELRFAEANSLKWAYRAVDAKKNFNAPDLARLFSLEANLVELPNGETVLPPMQSQNVLTKYGYSQGTKEVMLNHYPVSAVAVSPTGNRIASTSSNENGIVNIWNANDSSLIATFEDHQGNIRSASFSPDGSKLLTGGCGLHIDEECSGEILIHEVESGKLLVEMRDFGAEVTDVTFGLDGNIAYATLKNGSLIRFESSKSISTSNQKPVNVDCANDPRCEVQKLFDFSADALDLHPDGSKIALAGCEKREAQGADLYPPCDEPSVQIRNLEDMSLIHELSGPLDPTEQWGFRFLLDDLLSLNYSPDGKQLAIGSRDTGVYVLNVEKMEWDFVIGPQHEQSHSNWVWDVLFSPDGKTLVSVSADKSARLWDVDNNTLMGEPFMGHNDEILSVGYHPRNNHFITGSRDKSLRIWDLNEGDGDIQISKPHQSVVSVVAIGSKGDVLIAGSPDSTIKIWRIEDPETVIEFPSGHMAEISSIVPVVNQPKVVTGSFDNSIIVWELDSDLRATQVWSSKEYPGAILALAVDGNGQFILAGGGGDDYSLWLWDAETGERLDQELVGHTNWVTSVAFSLDGMHALSGSHDHSAIYWDVANGQAIRRFQDFGSWVTSVALDNNGKYAAIGTRDGEVTVWDLMDGASVFRKNQNQDGVADMVFTADGMHLLTASMDGNFFLWELDTAEKDQLEPVWIGETTTSVAAGQGGSYSAVGTETGSVYFYSERLPLKTLIEWTKDNRYVQCPDEEDLDRYLIEDGYEPRVNCDNALLTGK
jgi:WD40 repeat protein